MAATSLLWVFWVLGGLSLVSVAIMALLLTSWKSTEPGALAQEARSEAGH